MSPEQCRMARAGLSLGLRELARLARLPAGAVSRFEAGQGAPEAAVAALQKALERAGAQFVAEGGDAGVWLRRAAGEAATIPIEQLNAANDE